MKDKNGVGEYCGSSQEAQRAYTDDPTSFAKFVFHRIVTSIPFKSGPRLNQLGRLCVCQFVLWEAVASWG